MVLRLARTRKGDPGIFGGNLGVIPDCRSGASRRQWQCNPTERPLLTMSAIALPSDLAAEDLPAAGGAVISATGLVRRYGAGDTAVEALRRVSLDIEGGRMTAIMGPSGSGKSTLMHLLAGLDTPTSGSVTVDGREIGGLKEKALTQLAPERPSLSSAGPGSASSSSPSPSCRSSRPRRTPACRSRWRAATPTGHGSTS